MWLWTIYFWKKTKNMKTQIQNFKLTIVMMGMLLLPISCHKDDLRKPENLTSQSLKYLDISTLIHS